MSQSTERQVPISPVRVPAAVPNAQSEVTAVAGAKLQLEFDPTSSTVERLENDLVFSFDNGGKVIVSDFFVTDGAALPNLQMPDGTEVASADILAALNSDMDLSTAAGPAAQASPPGGGTSYDDDGGALIGGIDRLGSLGTDYWGRATDVTEQLRGVEVPGGSFDLGVTSSLDGAFGVAGLYEDGRPTQHIHGDTLDPVMGRINFSFSPSGTTVVDAIRLSGFEPGTKIFIGESGTAVVVGSTTDMYTFTQAQFTAPGVFVLPPADSDTDMNISAQVDVHAQGGGGSTTLNGSFTIIVDAAADAVTGVELDSDYGDAAYTGESTLTAFGDGAAVTPPSQFTNDGWVQAVLSGEGTLTEVRTVTFTVQATFGDSADGSEEHFVLVKVPAAVNGQSPWVVEGAEIYTLHVDSAGNPVYANADGSYPDGTLTADYYKVSVPSSSLHNGNGTVEVGITFPVGTAEDLTTGHKVEVLVGSEEKHFSGGEFDYSNNLSINSDLGTQTIFVNTFSGKFSIQAGWAYEGNLGNKDGGASIPGSISGLDTDSHSETQTSVGTQVQALGAPIRMEFSAGDGEAIDGAVTFTWNPALGTLVNEAGVSIGSSGTASVSVSDLTSGKIYFRPTYNSTSDEDIELSYSLTITDDSTTYTVSGKLPVVIDAVADLAKITASAADYDEHGDSSAHTAAAGGIGETITLKVTTNFVDQTGEKHYIMVDAKYVTVNGQEQLEWGLADGQKGELVTLYKDAAGNIIMPVGQDHSGQGATEYKVFLIDVTGDKLGASDYEVQMKSLVEHTKDTTGSFTVSTVTEEQVGLNGDTSGNKEYDTSNNLAVDSKDISYSISVLDGGLNISSSTVYEDDKPWQHTGSLAEKPGGITIALTDNDNTEEHIGAINGAAGSDAPAIQVTFSFSPDPADTPLGSFTYGTHTYTTAPGGGIVDNHDGTYTLSVPVSHIGANTDSVTLQYHAHGNDDTDLSVTKVEVGAIADGSGVTGSYTTEYTQDNPLLVKVDAVADKPTTGQVIVDVDPADKGYTAIAYGDAIEVKVSATFTDLDGSERHYLVVQKYPGWTCDDPNVQEVTIDGTTYFYVDVAQNASSADYTFTLKTPASSSAGTLTDGPLSLSQGGLAVEGEIKNGAITITGDKSTGTGAWQEESSLNPSLSGTYGNNVAFDNKSTNLQVNVINSQVMGTFTPAYEDHKPNQHTGSPTPNTTDGTVTLGIGNGTAIGQGGATAEHMTAVSFTFEFGGTTASEIPGTFSYKIGSTTYVLEPNTTVDGNGASYTFSDGKWSVTLPPASFANAGTNAADSVTFRYNPPANDSTDLKNFDYTIKVAADNSSATTTLEGHGTLNVDAVADQATFTALGVGDITYPAGQATAKPTDTVKVELSVTFDDWKDGSENQYIRIIDTAWTDSEFAGSGLTLTTITSATGAVIGQGLDVTAFIDQAYAALGNQPGTHTLSNGLTVTIGIDGKATVSFGVDVTIKDTAPDGGGKLEVQAVTVDHEPASESTATSNDTSYKAIDVPIKVGLSTTETDITLSMSTTGNQVFENDQPNAHIGSTSTTSPVADDPAGAAISLDNLKGDDVASVTLYLSGKNGASLAPTGDANGDGVIDATDGMYIEYDGVKHFATGPDGNGVWTITVDGVNQDDGTSMVFHPGFDYNSQDINFTYKVEVTDPTSGHQGVIVTNNPSITGTGITNVSGDRPPLTIEVDAVAQQPVIDDIGFGGKVSGDDTEYDFATPGETVLINATVTFEDYKDGSERHFLLVEAKAGWPAPTTLTIVDKDGISHDVPVSYTTQKYGGVMYYKIEIDNDDIENYGSGGTVTVAVGITSPGNATDTSFKVGALAWEDEAVAKTGTNAELTTENNKSWVVGETVPVQFDQAHAATVGKGSVYEDAGSATISFNVAEPGETISGLTLTCGGGGTVQEVSGVYTVYDAAGVATGTLSFPAGVHVELSGDGKTFTLTSASAGAPLTGVDVTYTPAADSDKDFPFSYEVTTRDPDSGDTHTTTGSSKVVVDAVADMPTQLGGQAWDVAANGGAGDWVTTVTVEHDYKLAENGSSKSVQLKVAATFGDYKDGTESHFILVEAKANMSVKGANGVTYDMYEAPDGLLYFKIPVDGALTQALAHGAGTYDGINVSFDASGKAVVSAGVTLEIISRQLSLANPSVELNIGALAVEKNSDQELTYDNNTAFTSQGSITIVNKWPGGTVIWVDPAYENDTPVAHRDDAALPGIQPDESTSHGLAGIQDAGQIHWGSDITDVTVTLTAGADGAYPGSILVLHADGTHTLHTNGSATVTGAYELEHMYFVPNKNYSDTDISLGYTAHKSDGSVAGSGTFPVIVDAVAQMPTDAKGEATSYDGPNSEPHSAIGALNNGGNEGEATIRVSGNFADKDGSEQHYALMEKTDGYTIVGPQPAEVYHDGKTWYIFDMDDASFVDVKIKITDLSGMTKNADGTYTYSINTGVMAKEGATGSVGNFEADLSNNVAWNLTGKADVVVSLVDSDVSVSIGDEMNENGSLPIDLSVFNVMDGQHDEFVNLTLNINGEGSFTALVFENNEWVAYDLSGMLSSGGKTLTITDQLLAERIRDGEIKLNFEPKPYSDKDVSITWSAQVNDTLSGDQKHFGGPGNGTINITVDAVAQAPYVDDITFSGENGTAAVSGGTAVASATLTFDDTDGSEIHYAVLGQGGVWHCTTVTINGQEYPVTTIFTEDGNPCYAVKISNSMLDEDGSVKVDFTLTAPKASGDVSGTIKIGGISVEPTTGAPGNPTGGGGELTLENNWAENLPTVPVRIGVVETTKVEFCIDTLQEGAVDGWANISLSQATQDALTTNNEKVTEADFVLTQSGLTSSMVGNVIGTIIYDGTAYEIKVELVDGKFVGKAHVDFGSGGFDASKAQLVWGTVESDGQGGFTVTNWNHRTDDITLSTTSTVTDTASGDTVSDVAGGGTWDLTPTATAPTDVDITGNDAFKVNAGAASSTISITAHFPDADGSETHFILVEKPASGWNCTGVSGVTGSIGTVDYNGVTYFKIPVSGSLSDPVANIKLTPPASATPNATVDVSVGAMVTENGQNEYLFQTGADEDTLHITIGGIVTTGATMSIAGFSEDGSSPLTFNLANADADNYVSKVVVNIPTGFKIVASDGTTFAAGSRTLTNADDLAHGGYKLVPTVANWSGTVPTITYSVTVTQEDTGASKTFPASGTQSLTNVTVAPVVDVPDSLDATSAATVAPGHTANLTVTLKANFVDTDGSEQHFFLVKLPDGVALGVNSLLTITEVTDDALLAQFGGGPLYRVNTPNAAAQNVALNLVLSKGTDVDDITYMAGSTEQALIAAGPEHSTAYSDMGTVAVPDTELNIAPDASNTADSFNTTKYTETSGAVDATDRDGDTIAVTAVTHDSSTTVTGTDATGAYFEVAGQYGTLRVYENGSYIYTLDEAYKATAGQETFSYTVADGHGGTDTAALVINLANTNSAPTVSGSLNGSVGGASTVYAGNLSFTDIDGDTITSIKVNVDGTPRELLGSGGLTLSGTYGTLVIAENGSYTYTLKQGYEHMTGSEAFTLVLADEFGTSSPVTVTIGISPVNHAPVLGNNDVQFDPTYSYLSGQVAFSDVDMDKQGDSLSFLVNNTLVSGSGYMCFEGTSGNLYINAAGAYTYTPHGESSPANMPAGVLDQFDIKVMDAGGLFSEGQLNINIGSTSLSSATSGDDRMYGTAAGDMINGGAGNDTLFGFNGDDTISGGAGHDYIHGGSGADQLNGDAGNDTLYGGDGNDTINGGSGNDLIFAGKGDDILFGGAGADTFSWNVNDLDAGTDIIRGFSYNDGDKLCIGILGENDQILNLHDVLSTETANLDLYLAATVNAADITLKVTSGDIEQTIVLEMGTGTIGEYASYEAFRTHYNEASEDAQAAMLQHLLTNMTC